MTEVTGYDGDELRRAVSACEDLRGQVLAVRRYLCEEVCTGAGFTGLLSPLADVLHEVGGAVDDAALGWVHRWDAVTEEVLGTARALARVDDEVAGTFARLGAGL